MLYALYLRLHHLLSRRKAVRASVPTVCVGNVTVGGTGKTPHTEMILRKLLASERWAYSNIAVLSRGYKRRSKGFQAVPYTASASLGGDEPLQMARKFLPVTVAVDKDRVRGCKILSGELQKEGLSLPKADVIVLDDAFQYLRLKASVNIVLVDYNRPVFRDRLLPWGRLRDFPSRLQEAQAVIVSKCPAYLDEWTCQQWRRKLRLREDQLLFFTTLSYSDPQPVFPEADSRYTYSGRLILFTGIAADGPLRSYLSDKYKIVRRMQFPDHHRYTRADMRTLSAAVRDNPTACLMTTEKDAQRLREVKDVQDLIRQRLFYVPVEARFLTEEQDRAFTDFLLNSLQ